jgi:hypothetical protein
MRQKETKLMKKTKTENNNKKKIIRKDIVLKEAKMEAEQQ